MRHFILFIFAVLVVSDPAAAQPPIKLTLQQARAKALERHPRLRAASFEAQAAAQVPKQLQGERYPNVQLLLTGAGAGDNAMIGAGSLTTSTVLNRAAAGISVNQLLYDFGRMGNLVDSARLRANAAGHTADAARAQVLLEVDRAYFTALRRQALLRAAEQSVETRRLVLEQTRALQESGTRSGLDVSFASYDLAEAEIALARAQHDILAAYAELSLAMGSSDTETYELVDEPQLPSLPALDRMISEALAERPELKAQQAQRDAAYRTAEAEEALSKPNISAIWNAGWIPVRDRELEEHYNAAGINIRIPVFNGQSIKFRGAEARYRANASDEQLREIQNRIARDVRIAWLDADIALKRIRLAADLLDRARQSLDLARERYGLGLSSIVELSQAVLSATAAEIENSSARYEYLIQKSVLDYQSGRLR